MEVKTFSRVYVNFDLPAIKNLKTIFLSEIKLIPNTLKCRRVKSQPTAIRL